MYIKDKSIAGVNLAMLVCLLRRNLFLKWRKKIYVEIYFEKNSTYFYNIFYYSFHIIFINEIATN